MWGRVNYTSVVIGLAGLALGFFLNMYSNSLSNKKLLADLKDELQNIHTNQARGRSLPGAEQRKQELEGAIKVLESK